MRNPPTKRSTPRASKPSITTTTTAALDDAPQPPSPFTLAPPSLAPLLQHLDHSKLYITHIDTFPRAFKQRIFAVPLLLNLAIAAGLLWRASIALPFYAALLYATIDPRTAASTAAAARALPARTLAGLVARRAATLLLDFVLARSVAGWPLTFFAERGGNPVQWRWAAGFRDAEVVVRVSRGWGAQDVLGGGKVGGESAFFKVRVLPAVERGYVARKTGYLMMGRDWDLDFGAMVKGTRAVDAGEMELRELRRTVLVYDGRLGWLAWRAYDEQEGEEEEGRRRIVAFKDRLMAMGKESLFFRWVELVQYESSQPGGFTAERKARTIEKAEKLFAEQGVDFEAFAEAIGGVHEMPGMETQS